MKFGIAVYLDNIKVDLEDQGHGSKVKVTWAKHMFFPTISMASDIDMNEAKR